MDLNIDQYKQVILYYCERIISEEHIKIVDTKIDNKIMLSIHFIPPEWYCILDSNLQNDIMQNLQDHYQDQINRFIQQNQQQNPQQKRKHSEI